MTNLNNRIKTIEKKIIPKPKKELLNILLPVWKIDGKTYYKDREGNKEEYIESEHKETPILIYMKEGNDFTSFDAK